MQPGANRHRRFVRVCAHALFAAAALSSTGCYSVLNGWLDPTTLGHFTGNATTEIRTSLTLEDTPPGIPGAVSPSKEDLRLAVRDYPISPGDTLAIEINELRDRFVPYQAQAQVTNTGLVNLPILGRIRAAELTVPEFEDALRAELRERDVLKDPEVLVNPLFLQKATYSIFGIGVSASNNAPLRAGTFPIRRPDLRLLEAINQVGGLSEFVTDIYVFRMDRLDDVAATLPTEIAPGSDTDRDEPNTTPPPPGTEAAPEPATEPSAEADLLDAVLGDDEPQPGEQPSREDNEALLEPAPTSPYLYVNGEFVPNPSHESREGGSPGGEAFAPALDGPSPTVNWARIAGESSYRILRVSAEQLRLGDPYANIYVRAGDVIRIVSGEIGVFYVMGQVQRVGAYVFNSEPVTLKGAIAGAGGLAALAWPDRCTVYRRLGQREQLIQVNLDRVFAGKDADFLIRRGDIINVGTHPFAPFLSRIRQLTLPNPSTAIGYGFTYARNFADIDSFAAQSNPANNPSKFPNLFP